MLLKKERLLDINSCLVQDILWSFCALQGCPFYFWQLTIEIMIFNYMYTMLDLKPRLEMLCRAQDRFPAVPSLGVHFDIFNRVSVPSVMQSHNQIYRLPINRLHLLQLNLLSFSNMSIIQIEVYSDSFAHILCFFSMLFKRCVISCVCWYNFTVTLTLKEDSLSSHC